MSTANGMSTTAAQVSNADATALASRRSPDATRAAINGTVAAASTPPAATS